MLILIKFNFNQIQIQFLKIILIYVFIQIFTIFWNNQLNSDTHLSKLIHLTAIGACWNGRKQFVTVASSQNTI